MANETYRALVEQIVDERSKLAGLTDKSEVFESLVNSLILSSYDLTIDEIEDGDTDGSGDGQIDAMYVVVNGSVLTDEEEDKVPDKGPLEIDIIIAQTKFVDGFEENALKIIRSTARDLLDLNKEYGSSLTNYNERIQDKFAIARKALVASAGRAAKIRVRIFYASKASTDNIHPTVIATGETLKRDFAAYATASSVELNFLGAKEIIDLSRQPTTSKRSLELQDLLSSNSGDSFACLVTVDSLIKFLSDENGDLVRALFDANVRDFLGKTEVNDAIRATLLELKDEDFWWFNNGITIVAAAVDQKGKKLMLTDPLLVNGLQTSNVLYAFMTDMNIDDTLRNSRRSKIVLVKIIVPPNEQIRDGIVRATNSQTNIPKPYLRGMDLVHRNIEDHLRASNIFYERRKNQYKNAGKSRSVIITLIEMAQSLMAAFLFRGSDARGRPNSLLKSDDDYQKLFSEKYDLDAFKNVIEAKRSIMSALITKYHNKTSAYRNDIVFHILAFISERKFYNLSHASQGWKNNFLDDVQLDEAIATVVDLFEKAGGTDRVAKSTLFKTTVSKAAVARRSADQNAS
ncbi:AIPR family protein (plasmid) [Acetobacter orientalis]|uniref:AIPR family protein n=1 Tax=Acetobacter orientalis TaxID=146474 RepID=UPI00386B1AD9